MREFVNGRKVVIVNQKGKGNIEQAIFILKRNVKEPDGDYILEEAKQIVDEFVARNKMAVRGGITGKKWIVPVLLALSVIAGIYIFFIT